MTKYCNKLFLAIGILSSINLYSQVHKSKRITVSHYVEGVGRLKLEDSSQFNCYISKISGNFRNGSGEIRLGNWENFWNLEGEQKPLTIPYPPPPDEFHLDSICDTFSRDMLKKNKGGSFKEQTVVTKFTAEIAPKKIKLKPIGSHYCWLSGIKGKFNGKGEWVKVFQENDYWYLEMSAEVNKSKMKGSAFCAPSRSIPKLREYIWDQGQDFIKLKPVKTHICYLSGIRGRFKGWGESIFVQEKDGNWVLGGSSDQSGVRGHAYCQRKQTKNVDELGPTSEPKFTQNELSFSTDVAQDAKSIKVSLINPSTYNKTYCSKVTVLGNFTKANNIPYTIDFKFLGTDSSDMKKTIVLTPADFGIKDDTFQVNNGIVYRDNNCFQMDFEWACKRLNTPGVFSHGQRLTLNALAWAGISGDRFYDFTNSSYNQATCESIGRYFKSIPSKNIDSIAIRYSRIQEVAPLLLVDEYENVYLDGNRISDTEILKSGKKGIKYHLNKNP